MEGTATGEVKAPDSVGTQVQTDVNPWTDEYSPSPDLAESSTASGEVATPVETTQQVTPQEGVQSAETLNTVTTPGETVIDGTAAQPEPRQGPIPYERFQEVISEKNTLKTERENYQKMAEFYQTQYNELVAKTTGQPPQQTPETVHQPGQVQPDARAVPEQLPAGIKPPSQWETQEDMAAYFDHAATTKAQTMAQNMLSQAYQNTIVPQMQAINKWVGALEEMVVKSTYKDFDDVTQSVMGELFVTDHEGKIWTDPAGNPKVKNPALLNYIRQSPMPRKALYDYALSKKAPEKIADTVKTTTEQLLKAIDTKPKGPTVPKQAGGEAGVPALDWNTPADIVDQHFKAHGIS